ncbi:hypothetical protein T4D_8559 [Trichinella pseudospiralis]|uniref:Uncharacterized protein n=1 Tax=Trichinella pseudospiralis TaxID=6337 RepID=A0A0V1ESC8_TRIPS|nr:hypothetical protein T4D_8559 [Trichinella pseudospiralis]
MPSLCTYIREDIIASTPYTAHHKSLQQNKGINDYLTVILSKILFS